MFLSRDFLPRDTKSNWRTEYPIKLDFHKDQTHPSCMLRPYLISKLSPTLLCRDYYDYPPSLRDYTFPRCVIVIFHESTSKSMPTYIYMYVCTDSVWNMYYRIKNLNLITSKYCICILRLASRQGTLRTKLCSCAVWRAPMFLQDTSQVNVSRYLTLTVVVC